MNDPSTNQAPSRHDDTLPGVRIHDPSDLPWTSPGKEGLRTKAVRRDDERGRFLGLLAFDPMTATGVHQHLGPAFTYVLAGGLTDYTGDLCAGQVGINLDGSTHEAIAYMPSLFVARLEAPVIYEAGVAHQLHAGGQPGALANRHPERPPDINLTLTDLPLQATCVPGVMRRMVFDYTCTTSDHRFVQLVLQPGSSVPAHRCVAPLEGYVIAGDLTLNGQRADSGHFFTVEPGTRLSLLSTYGASVLVWSEGRTPWCDVDPEQAGEGAFQPDLYGFDAVYRPRRV